LILGFKKNLNDIPLFVPNIYDFQMLVDKLDIVETLRGMVRNYHKN
jgi:hypothetical protein